LQFRSQLAEDCEFAFVNGKALEFLLESLGKFIAISSSIRARRGLILLWFVVAGETPHLGAVAGGWAVAVG